MGNVIQADFCKKEVRLGEEPPTIGRAAVKISDRREQMMLSLKKCIDEAAEILTKDVEYFGVMTSLGENNVSLWPLGNYCEFFLYLGSDKKIYSREYRLTFDKDGEPKIAAEVCEFDMDGLILPEPIIVIIVQAVRVNVEAYGMYHCSKEDLDEDMDAL